MNTTQFGTALKLVQHSTEPKSNMPVLRAARIENTPAGIAIRTTCFDREITVRLPGKLLGGDTVVVALKPLRKFLDALNANTLMELEVTDGKLTARADGERVAFQTIAVDEFPDSMLANPKLTSIVEPRKVNALGFVDAYEWVQLACSTDDTRWNLTNVRFESTGRLWATDGHRVHVRTMTPPLSPEPCQIRNRTLDAIRAALAVVKSTHLHFTMLGHAPDESGTFGKKLHVFSFVDAAEKVKPGTGLAVELVDFEVMDEYMPDIDQVIPDTLEVLRGEIQTAQLVQRLKMVGKLGMNVVKLRPNLSKSTIDLLAKGEDNETYDGTLALRPGCTDARVKDNPNAPNYVALSSLYLTEAANGMASETCTIELYTYLSPIVLRSPVDESFAVVMPIRT